jgi:hypothetical protein
MRLFAIYCNKNMLQDAGRKMPYDEVRNGEWTLDMLAALSTDLYQDDGDGIRNSADIYGFSSSWDCNGAAFLQASDIFLLTKTDDDYFELTPFNDRLVNMYDKLYAWSKDESVNLWNIHSPAITSSFKDEETYMMTSDLGASYLDVEFKVGILPLPKYDVNQENYAHVNWGNNVLIPSSVQDYDMVGEVVELMSFYTGTMVMDKYYNEVLQLRVSEAPDDRDMVELIYNTVVYDPGMVYAHAGGSNTGSLYPLCYTFHTCYGENKNTITSFCQAYMKAAQKQLDNVVKKVLRRYQ